MSIQNPILTGFYPDPSICRVGGNFYLVNSTFEWFPGVPVHHSRDLRNWRLIGHILTEKRLLDLRGVADSAGVWAPSLSYADGKFWLIYTNIHNTGSGRPFKDIRICLTTATDILGPWSDPIKLDSIGFDPSLFHDTNGRKYLLNIEWDFRKDHYRFAGIVIQEYDPAAGRLTGERHKILRKPDNLTEGPNLYQKDGWYFLMLAEGGTGWNHGISAARSRSVLGPYELDPQASVLTTRDTPDWWLQKAGHGELVETAAGEWYLAHLGSRPVGDRRCVLGRETCLQRVVWEDGWLRLAHGGTLPERELPNPTGIPEHPWAAAPDRDDFDTPSLDPSWSSLRVPADRSWVSLTALPGWLRLTGRDSLHSYFEQSLLAKRLTHFRATATTRMRFAPSHFTQMAGLVCYYDTRTHYYLRVTHHEEHGIVIGVVLTDDTTPDETGDISVGDWTEFHLRAVIDRTELQFEASPDGVSWRGVGPRLDFTKLSDDYGTILHFTGAMVGICVQDLGGTGITADFDYFEMTTSP
ncbi:MAG: glycoside hydrolase family 43 protein [Verrucomicrobia bacterium]|nr:glycoside hydrolase family 43 protein [Verrucomicrobiota bacterium]